MKRLWMGLLAMTWALGAGLAQAPPQRGLEAIKREPKLEKRAQKALQYARKQVNAIVPAYHKGDPGRGEALLDEILEAVELARQSLYDTGKDPYKKPKPFKKAEIATRRLLEDLEDVERGLRFDWRRHLQQVSARIGEINDELLMAIMTKKRK